MPRAATTSSTRLPTASSTAEGEASGERLPSAGGRPPSRACSGQFSSRGYRVLRVQVAAGAEDDGGGRAGLETRRRTAGSQSGRRSNEKRRCRRIPTTPTSAGHPRLREAALENTGEVQHERRNGVLRGLLVGRGRRDRCSGRRAVCQTRPGPVPAADRGDEVAPGHGPPGRLARGGVAPGELAPGQA